MNIRVPEKIRQKYPNMEFRGKPRQFKGRTVIEATNHSVGKSYYYSFDEDFFWFCDQIPDWKLPVIR